MHADVMHIDSEMFLVSVLEPLNLTLQFKIENESRMSLVMGLQGQLAVLQSRGFMLETVYTDPHSTFRSMTQDFPSVTIDVGHEGDYIAKVDAKICRIKETFCKIKLGLPWKLPMGLIEGLVAYAVSHINILELLHSVRMCVPGYCLPVYQQTTRRNCR